MNYQRQGDKIVQVKEVSAKSIKSRITTVTKKRDHAMKQIRLWQKDLDKLEVELRELHELSKDVA